MDVLVELCLIPQGGDISLSDDIAECQKIFRARGLSHQLHAFGTNVEGEWDNVMGAIKACHERVHERGRVRILSTLKIATRSDRQQRLRAKVVSVEEKLTDGHVKDA